LKNKKNKNNGKKNESNHKYKSGNAWEEDTEKIMK
jgi:hypothetical protein